MAKVCCILLLILSFTAAQAQPAFQLSGKVTDTAGIAISHATVQYVAGPDTLNTATSDDGRFALKNLRAGKFRLSVTMKGFLPFSHAYAILTDKGSVQLQPFALQPDYNQLDPVTVTRIRPITIQEDTTSYNVAAFPVRDGSEVEDILKRLPGVEVDINGNVIVQGKPITKVLVNGKEFFGSDVLLAIQNLPADVVSKLQIIDDYGDKSRLTGVRSGESSKVLNIILKPDKQNGEFGRLEAAGGDQGKYKSDAFANTFKNDRQLSANGTMGNDNPTGNDLVRRGGLNYANQWDLRWSGAFNLNTSTQSPHSANSVVSTSYYPGEELQQTQNSTTSSHSDNNNFNSRLTFKPDSYTTLRLNTTGAIGQSTSQISSKFSTLQQDSGYTKSTSGISLNNSQSKQQNLNSGLYYEKLSPNSRRRFSIQASAGYTGSNLSGNSQSAASILTDSVPGNSSLHYVTTNQSHGWDLNLNSSYFLPLGSASFLEMGYRAQSSTSFSNILTRQPDSVTGVFQAVDSLSENMVLRNMVQDIHAGYTGKLHQFDLTAALNAQPGQNSGTVDTKGDHISYHYFSLFPDIQTAWNVGRQKKINFSYNRQPSLPSLQQLSPFTNVSNPQYPITGNPGLKPSYTSYVALHYEQSSLRPTNFFGFGIGITYSSTQHTIIQNLTTPKDSSLIIQATTYLNAGSTNNLTTDYHLTLPAFFNKRLRINYSGTMGESDVITMTDGIRYPTQTWTWAQTLHLQLLIPDLIESGISGTYSESHSTYSASSLPNAFRSASLTFNSRHYFFHYWILNYQLDESYTSNGSRLETAPAILTASLQRQFLPHNMATVTLTGYNLFNQSAVVGQSSSPTTITQTRPVLTGRYLLLSFLIKLNRFHH